MTEIGLQASATRTGQRVAYHSACSLQHGPQVRSEPKRLQAARFEAVDVPEEHLCCGSAGTYNLLRPEIAGQLRNRKVANIERTRPDLVAAGNIGCHIVELLDWATGEPFPGGAPREHFQEAVLSSPEGDAGTIR